MKYRVSRSMDMYIYGKRKLHSHFNFHFDVNHTRSQTFRRRKKMLSKSRINHCRAITLLAMMTLAEVRSEYNEPIKYTTMAAFDAKSFPIGIDNGASACISPTAEDFVGNL